MSLLPYRRRKQEIKPEVASPAEVEEVLVKTAPGVVVDSAAVAVEDIETPVAEASVTSEASAAPSAEAVLEAAVSLETPVAEAPVISEASAFPPLPPLLKL